jgi:hypothetical protein
MSTSHHGTRTMVQVSIIMHYASIQLPDIGDLRQMPHLVWSTSDSACAIVWAGEAFLVTRLRVATLGASTARSLADNIALVDSILLVTLLRQVSATANQYFRRSATYQVAGPSRPSQGRWDPQQACCPLERRGRSRNALHPWRPWCRRCHKLLRRPLCRRL